MRRAPYTPLRRPDPLRGPRSANRCALLVIMLVLFCFVACWTFMVLEFGVLNFQL